ncbi:MAG: hypothetical protein MUC80_03305 [Candidatus Thermoplasmatota archaeon]|jgi:hypothetical protein|nr:hypothetical protein [Candidatus Thermoplasmatota archaeon]
MAKDMMGKVAIWAFIIGALIALLVGLWQAYTLEQNEQPVFTTDMGGWIAWILAILGAIVGLLAMLGKGTITKSEIPAFLMAGIALLVMYGTFQGFSIDPWIGSLFRGVSQALAIFIAPAVGILAIKAIWDIGKDE